MTSVTAAAKLSIAGSVAAEDSEVAEEFAREEVEDEREEDSEAAPDWVLAAVAGVVVALLATGPVGVRRDSDAVTDRAFERPDCFSRSSPSSL